MKLRDTRNSSQRTLRSDDVYILQAMQSHERLRQARERASYVRASDAARAFGWPVSTYLGHENGSRGLTKDAAERYARAFKVTWQWLLGGGEAADDPQQIGTPIYWEAETGAYRARSPIEREHCDTIPVGVWGFEPSRLFAVTLAVDPGLYLICNTTHGEDILFVHDQIVVERRDGNGRSEVAAWRIFNDNEGVARLHPVGGGGGRALTFAELKAEDHAIHGVVIAEYRIFERQRPIDLDGE